MQAVSNNQIADILHFNDKSSLSRISGIIITYISSINRELLERYANLNGSCIYWDTKSFFFPIWVFFHEHSRITGRQEKGEGISLTPHYHFPLLHGRLDISRAITAESSPLHIANSRTRTGNLWFPSANRQPLSYGSLKCSH